MSVFREVEMGWGGKTYTVTPSNKVLRRIESEGISLVHMAERVAKGEPPLSQLALVIATLLQQGGAKVTEDEIYLGLVDAAGSKEIVALAENTMLAIFPTDIAGKKPDAPKAASTSGAK